MEEFFQTYGPWIIYLIIFAGSIIEGESVVLTCSALAYKYDEISLPVLMFLAFLGSVLSDQICFFIGHWYGPGLIKRRPKLKKASEKVFYYLRKQSTIFIFSFRFIYGIRVASPFIIGACGISIKRFAVLNFLAAIVWSVISCSLGYMLGYFFADSVTAFIAKAEGVQKWVVIGIVILLVLVFIAYKIYNRGSNRLKDNEIIKK